MARKPLKEYFEQILQQCTDGANIGDRYCCSPKDGVNYISFEDEGYCVDGMYELKADKIEDGDGYWTPCVIVISHAIATIRDLSVFWSDPETYEKEEVSQTEIDELVRFLEKNIPHNVEY